MSFFISGAVNKMNITCPECTAVCRVDDARIPKQGIYGKCPQCQNRFFLQGVPAAVAETEERPAATPDRAAEIVNAERSYDGEPDFGEYRLKQDRKPPPSVAPILPPSRKEREKIVPGPPHARHPALSRFVNAFLGAFSHDMAIDLGTANTLVYIRRRGIVLNEPSVVALHLHAPSDKQILAVGEDAKKMLGRTPDNIRVIRPMRDGVIADFEAACTMLKHYIRKVKNRFPRARSRVVVAVPHGITPVERRAVQISAEQMGARSVSLIEEPIAAAIGAGLPIAEPRCNMVVDIGGGTTEVAVISLGGIVAAQSLRVAGDKMDAAIQRYIKRRYKFEIGESTAEKVKIAIGNARLNGHDDMMDVKGWDIVTGRPKILPVSSGEIREALVEQIDAIVEAVRAVLERTPQELASDVIENGILLSGGGALLKNLDRYLTEVTGVPFKVARDPLKTVVLGAGKTFADARLFRQAVMGG